MVVIAPYERDVEIDVASELAKLRALHAKFQDEKKLKEKKNVDMSMKARPSEAQLRLYREGVNKMNALKMDEEFVKAHDQFTPKVPVRYASPSPICERLYAEGMAKVLSKREYERKQQASASRRKATCSPVCDRLYQEGLEKVKAHNNASRSRINSARSIRSASPNPTCDRLYEHGKAKLRSTSQTRGRDNTPLLQDEKLRKLVAAPCKRSNSIDRMYEHGKAKLRSTSTSTSQTRRNETAEKGTANLCSASNSRLPPSPATSPDTLSRGRFPFNQIHNSEIPQPESQTTHEDVMQMGVSEMKIHHEQSRLPFTRRA